MKQFSCSCKCKFDSTACSSNRKWNNDEFYHKCKKHRTCWKYYSWNPSTYVCENRRYLKSIIDDLGIVCDEIIRYTESCELANVTNPISANVTVILFKLNIKCQCDCYIFRTFLLVVILVFIIAIIC